MEILLKRQISNIASAIQELNPDLQEQAIACVDTSIRPNVIKTLNDITRANKVLKVINSALLESDRKTILKHVPIDIRPKVLQIYSNNLTN